MIKHLKLVFFLVFLFGGKNDGGIGGYFNKSAEGQIKYFLIALLFIIIYLDYIGWTFDGKAIFDFLFNFVIVILVTEIISGFLLF